VHYNENDFHYLEGDSLKRIYLTLPVLFLLLLLSACSSGGRQGSPPDGRLQVVATTSIVGDVVGNIGGELIELTVLVPPGGDPHTFEPRPQDIAAVSDAQVVFASGLGLEEALKGVLEANVKGTLVEVSDGLAVIPLQDKDEHEGAQPEHGTGDPHTWMDPNNVIIWAGNIATALAEADTTNRATYQTNAESYIAELRELDAWIRQQVEQVPPKQRKLVSDHAVLGYFAAEYGFEQVGLVIPALSSSAAPSAQELAALVDAIRAQDVQAILVGTTVNPALSEQVADDTGAELVFIYTGSLSQPGGVASSYIQLMRYNVQAIVDTLK
jgi:manganese/iron transport system substrate-binding protein